MNLLILRQGALGDTLMLAPAAVCLSSNHNLMVAGREPGISFLHPVVDGVFDVERGGWHRLFSKGTSTGGLPVVDPDVVVGFFADHDGVVAENLARFFPGSEALLFPPFPERGRSIHVAGYMAECLCAAGLPVDEGRAVSTALEEAVLREGTAEGKMPLAVFHPGSGDSSKNHPVDMWRDLALKIGGVPAGTIEHVVWLLGPAEMRNRAALEAALGTSGDETMICPGAAELSQMLEKCSLFVGHDSGVTHLAAMTGAPCLALFRGSDPVLWRPLGPAVEVVSGLDGEALIERAAAAAMDLMDS